MSKYTVKKLFEQFQVGDVINFNDRQAKYLLVTGHIVPAEVSEAAAVELQDLTSDPEAKTEAGNGGIKKAKKDE